MHWELYYILVACQMTWRKLTNIVATHTVPNSGGSAETRRTQWEFVVGTCHVTPAPRDSTARARVTRVRGLTAQLQRQGEPVTCQLCQPLQGPAHREEIDSSSVPEAEEGSIHGIYKQMSKQTPKHSNNKTCLTAKPVAVGAAAACGE